MFIYSSEEDLTTIKASLYLFKKISLKFPKLKICETLIKPAIRLTLVATSRVCLNTEISATKLSEVKENVSSNLKHTLKDVTTTKLMFSIFNVQHKSQVKPEIQVRNKYIYIVNYVYYYCIDFVVLE